MFSMLETMILMMLMQIWVVDVADDDIDYDGSVARNLLH